jgi:glycosyltransferase involved in cell wall biosynthesis
MAAAPWNVRVAQRLSRLIARDRPDVAHVHNTWFAMTPAVLRTLSSAGVPVVMTLHNYRLLCTNASLFRDGDTCQDCVGRTAWPGVQHKCYRASVVASSAVAATIMTHRAVGTWRHHVDRFVVLNTFARDIFIRGGIPADKLWIKPNFSPDHGRRHSAPSSSRTVLFVGRTDRLKGLGVLLDAWSLTRPGDLQLVIVGDGPERDRYEHRGIPGVRFVGRQPAGSVREWMQSSRALVFPSLLYEGQPMVVLEAFAAGLPVIAAEHGGNVELVGQFGERWLAAPADVHAWSRAIQSLQHDDGIDATGAHVRAVYEESYSEPAALGNLLDVYRSVGTTTATA